MERLVEMIESYHPGFKDAILPADEDDVEMIDEYFTGELPGAYRRFLSTMGGSTGDLEVEEASFELGPLRRTYRMKQWLRRDRYLRIAFDRGLDALDYYLDLAAPHGDDDRMVVRMPLLEDFDPQSAIPHHAGLEEFLYYQAFRNLRLPQLDHRLCFVLPPDRKDESKGAVEAVFAHAERLGFQRIPPSTRNALFERGDAAILLYRHPTQDDFFFELGCSDAAGQDRLTKAFTTNLGVITTG
jgi:hypothetical protein